MLVAAATAGLLTQLGLGGSGKVQIGNGSVSALAHAARTCADRSVLRTGSIYMADLQEDGSRLVVGLVGDGHTYAEANGRRAPVQNNAFVLNHMQGGDLTVGSPTASQHVDIGG